VRVETPAHPAAFTAEQARSAFAFESNSPKTADPLPDIWAMRAPQAARVVRIFLISGR
jgi:hypothetical protein